LRCPCTHITHILSVNSLFIIPNMGQNTSTQQKRKECKQYKKKPVNRIRFTGNSLNTMQPEKNLSAQTAMPDKQLFHKTDTPSATFLLHKHPIHPADYSAP